MESLQMYCLSIHDGLYKKINDLNYIPAGLGDFNYNDKWVRDNTGENISYKNQYYGEYTFHYWFWKNLLQKNDSKWIGFCAQRRFWSKYKDIKKIKSFKDLSESVLKKIPSEWNNYDAIIGDEVNIANIPWIKIIKYGKKALYHNPGSFFKNKRNIKFQFDMFHGCGVLEKAINLLPNKDRYDFNNFVTSRNSFNQGNMFICNSKEIMNEYYNSIFSWLSNCEKVFGFNLNGYGQVRLYAFLAERYLPYWFSKYTNKLDWPILFYDLRGQIDEK